MSDTSYYDVSILLISKQNIKSFESLCFAANSKFDARVRAEKYIKEKYNSENWKSAAISSIKESTYK